MVWVRGGQPLGEGIGKEMDLVNGHRLGALHVQARDHGWSLTRSISLPMPSPSGWPPRTQTI